MPAVSHRTDLGQGFLQRVKSGLAALPARIVSRIIGGLARRFEYRRQMRHLAELDDHLLRDIGLPRAQSWRGAIVTKPPRDRSLKP